MSSRPETGPMKFGDDWTGVFLRGDYAGPMGFALRGHVEAAQASGAMDLLTAAMLLGLADDLDGCDERGERLGLQAMRPFAECVAPRSQDDVG